MDRNLDDHTLGGGRYSFLFYLYHHNGATQDEISKDIEIDKASTARALRKLENGGFILRKTDEHDRRINHVFLTEKGQNARNVLVGLSDNWKDLILDGLTQNEISTLEKLFLKLKKNVCLNNCEKDG